MLWMMLVLNGWAEEDARAAQKAMISHELIQSALTQGVAKAALKHIKDQLAGLECPQRIPIAADLATLYVDQGYAYHLLQNDEKVQTSWEQAFSANPEIQFDRALFVNLTENEQEDLLNRFEQIRGLVEAQGILDPQIPETDGVKVFVDGRKLTAGQGVKPGMHLAQIVCPTDGLQSIWTNFEKPVAWDALCPSGFADQASSTEEDFFGGGLFAAAEDTSEYYNPEPVCDDGGISFQLPSFSFSGMPDFTSPTMLSLTSGVGLVATGAVAYYVWVAPAYEAVESARVQASQQSITESEAAEISKAFNVARYTTLGLFVSGTALTGYGTYLSIQQVSITPTLFPGGVGVLGHF